MSDVDPLTNGNLLPVVFSINCASGIFDQKTVDPAYGNQAPSIWSPSAVYFGERMLRKANGEAVAVIGDMRSSNTNANNDLAYGLFTGFILAQIFGPVHVGNLLTFAKLWLQLKGWTGSGLLNEIEIYNLLGDPTLAVWTHQPPSSAILYPSALVTLIFVASIVVVASKIRRSRRATPIERDSTWRVL